LIVRDRSSLLALVAMPVIFIGVQIFGAAGWGWTTGNLPRVSCFAYSLALYMGTIGPLTHIAGREARVLDPAFCAGSAGAPARRQGARVGDHRRRNRGRGCSRSCRVSVRAFSVEKRLAAGLLVTAGAAGMSFVAVAMASGGADLSDETNNAVGPSTIYAYLFVVASSTWC
jgi:hypothetical protein